MEKSKTNDADKKKILQVRRPRTRNSTRNQRKAAGPDDVAFMPSGVALRALFENAPVGIFISTLAGQVLSFNTSGAAMFGYASPEQFVAEVTDPTKHVYVFPEQRDEIVRKALNSVDFVRAEVSYRRKDGSVFLADLYMRAVRDARGEPILEGFVEDITERKRAQAALQQSEARHRTLVERAPLPIACSRDGIILYLNPKFLKLFRYQNAEALVGRPVKDIAAPEYQAMVEERVRRRSQGLPVAPDLEAVAQRGDGSQFPVKVATTEVELPDGPAILAFFMDITELKQAQAELRRHQEHLEELVAARTAELHSALADLEHMSYSMVHDMRAPLRAMLSFAQIIQAECPECRRTPCVDYLQRICEASSRLDRLITDALNYNKLVRENPELMPVDLGKLLLGLVNTYPNLQPPVADISIDLTTELVVMGNESLLTQCFGNLLDNAVKFVAPGVHPRIRVWAQASTLDDQPATSIYVADNGIGILKALQEHIFSMFQRMHHESEYPGTGIGLAIVKKAVERMGGRVTLESDPGRGTTFCVELPGGTSTQIQSPLPRVA